MKKIFILTVCTLSLSYSQTQIGLDINGEAAYDNSGSCIALSANGNIVAIGAIYNDGNGEDSGHVRVYQNISGNWTQIGSDINGEAANDQCGSGVSLSSDGSIVAVGAFYNDGSGNESGHVRIYKNILGNWTQIGNEINGDSFSNWSGKSVALSANGNIVAIGGYGNDSNGTDSGIVHIFEFVSGNWTQIAGGIIGDAPYDFSGFSVALSSDGNTVAIGSIGTTASTGLPIISGHVRVFQNISANWTQIGNNINGAALHDAFGSSVAMSSDGNIVAIGAYKNDENGIDSGQVRVYQNVSGNWIQIGSNINGEAAGDYSGIVSLSSDGSVLIIGSYNNDGNGLNSGNVRIYQNINGVWTLLGNNIYGEAEGDRCGNSFGLSSDGSILAIASTKNDGNGIDSGHVRVFDLTSLLHNNSFVMENYVIYPNPTTNFVTINLNSGIQLEKVNLYSELGQYIKSEKSKKISFESLANGNYILEVVTNKGKASKIISKK